MPVLILLAIAWAVFLVPPYLRNRSEDRLSTSVHSFRHGLDVLGRATPGAPRRMRSAPVPPGPGVPQSRAEARKRRRDVLLGLVGAAAFTFLVALAFGGVFLAVHLLVDVALVGYAYLLVQLRKIAEERDTKVRYLSSGSAGQASLVTLRRSASG